MKKNKKILNIIILASILALMTTLSSDIGTGENSDPLNMKDMNASAIQELVDDEVATFAMNATHIFWAKMDGTNDTIYTRPIAGGTSTPLIYNQQIVEEMDALGNYLVWSTLSGGTGQNGTVMFYNASNGATTQLADTPFPREVQLGTPVWGLIGVWVLFTNVYLQLIPEVELKGGLYSIRSDGTNFHQISNTPQYSPLFSPDGDDEVFCHNSTAIFSGTFDVPGLSIICQDSNINDIACDSRPVSDILIFYTSDADDSNNDGYLKRTTRDTGTISVIRSGLDCPHGLVSGANELILVESGYINNFGKIARCRNYGAFDDFMYITGRVLTSPPRTPDSISHPYQVDTDTHWPNYITYLDTDYHELFLHYMYDDDGPTSPDISNWGVNNTTIIDTWTVEWQPSNDLNGVEEYTIQESTSEDFVGAASFTTNNLEKLFSSKAEGTYFYRVRARDNVTDPMRSKTSGTLGNWSEVIRITYQTLGNPSIPGFEVFFIVLGLSCAVFLLEIAKEDRLESFQSI